MRRTCLCLLLTLGGANTVDAQVEFRVEAETSLAWWQIDPNYGHLWATTCPADPSWQAGEGRSGSAPIDVSTRKSTVATAYHDERVPLYPRGAVHPVCRVAVRGELVTTDSVTFRDLRGVIAISVDSLFNGLEIRDRYARNAVFETRKYPEVLFQLDSLVSVTPGDTVTAVAAGHFELRGVRQAMRVPVRAWREDGRLRAQAQVRIPARALTKEYGMSRLALGMGVVMGRWETVFAGVDVMLRRL